MADGGEPRYLSAPRDGGAVEFEHLRDQARFYNALPELARVRLRLVPACSRCASDDMRHDNYAAALVCNTCGNRDSSTEIRSGRLAAE